MVILDDGYLLASNLTGMIPLNEVLWFTSSTYSTITLNNFNSVNPSNFFDVSFTTSPIVLNLRYIVLGDVDLSSSSQ